jgi:NitT/TauT family transport system substrate-binding protein
MNSMGITRRDFLARSGVAVAAIAVGGVAAACAEEGDVAQDGTTSTSGAPATTTSSVVPEKFSVMMPFTLNLQFIADVAAKAGGFMEKAGIDLDIQFARGQGQAVQQLAANSVSLIRSSPLSVIQAVSNENAPFQVVGILNQKVLYSVVSTSSKPINSVEDLEGKTLGFPTLGGNAEETFDIIARDHGFDPASVERVAAGSDAAGLALVEQGRVAALFAITEAAAILTATSPTAKVLDFDDENPLLGNALVTTKQAAEEKKELIVRYVRGLREAMLAIADEDQRADLIPKIRAEFDLPILDDATKANAAIDAISSLWFAAGEDNLLRNVEERWEDGLEGFQKLGLVKEGVEAEQVYTNDFVDAASGK